jgi:hypothetical protein
LSISVQFAQVRKLGAAMFAAVAIALVCLAVRADNPPPGDLVGAIDGEAISVDGPMSVEASHGQVRTNLRSGSNVHVKSGTARIDLVEGGQISICGPAHFSVLKSGKSLTIALESGTLHAHIEGEPNLTVYTPQVQAQPISIGNGAQDTLVGVDASGTMCIRANHGAVRVEQQLTGQSVLIPQSGDVSLANGQLETMSSAPGHCVCEIVQSVKAPPAPAQPAPVQVSQLATPEEIKARAEKKAEQPQPATPKAPDATAPEPVYQVFMPPLRYDSSAKVQTDYDPNLVVLVRRVRVRPTLILQGRVEGDPIVALNTAPTPPPAATPKPAPASKPQDDSTWNRVRTFVHKLLSPTS